MSTKSFEITSTSSSQLYHHAQSRLRALGEALAAGPGRKSSKTSKTKGSAAEQVERPEMLDELIFCRTVGNLENYLMSVASDILLKYPALMKADAISFDTMMQYADMPSLLKAMVQMRVLKMFQAGPDELAQLLADNVKFQLFTQQGDQTRVADLLARKKSLEWEIENLQPELNRDSSDPPCKEVMEFCDRIVVGIDSRIVKLFSIDHDSITS